MSMGITDLLLLQTNTITATAESEQKRRMQVSVMKLHNHDATADNEHYSIQVLSTTMLNFARFSCGENLCCQLAATRSRSGNASYAYQTFPTSAFKVHSGASGGGGDAVGV